MSLCKRYCHVLYVGESKHWQRKAQSLSKDLQRLMSTGNDVMSLKEDNIRLSNRVEVNNYLY
jgi:hypothetical protein